MIKLYLGFLKLTPLDLEKGQLSRNIFSNLAVFNGAKIQEDFLSAYCVFRQGKLFNQPEKLVLATEIKMMLT